MEGGGGWCGRCGHRRLAVCAQDGETGTGRAAARGVHSGSATTTTTTLPALARRRCSGGCRAARLHTCAAAGIPHVARTAGNSVRPAAAQPHAPQPPHHTRHPHTLLQQRLRSRAERAADGSTRGGCSGCSTRTHTRGVAQSSSTRGGDAVAAAADAAPQPPTATTCKHGLQHLLGGASARPHTRCTCAAALARPPHTSPCPPRSPARGPPPLSAVTLTLVRASEKKCLMLLCTNAAMLLPPCCYASLTCCWHLSLGHASAKAAHGRAIDKQVAV